jgi:NAD(P) transhydrogenase subunit alpha
MSPEYQAKQAALVAEHIKKQDIVITTALIPGRAAPRLVTEEQVLSMKPGSVLIDLAVEQGGNVAGARPDEVVSVGGARIVGITNLAGRIPADASSLYARNLAAFVALLLDKDGSVAPNLEDEILKSSLVTHAGDIVHPALHSV